MFVHPHFLHLKVYHFGFGLCVSTISLQSLQKNEISINKLEKQIFNLNQQMIYPSHVDKKSQ